MSKVAFSPVFMVVTPSSQPYFEKSISDSTVGRYSYSGHIPLMTLPTPIWVTKAPRPTDESNLGATLSATALWNQSREGSDLLAALGVGLGWVLQPTSVLNGHCVADFGDGARAL